AMNKGLNSVGKAEFERRLFESSREYGKALRRFKTERGYPYPGYYSTEEIDRLEEASKNDKLSDTDKQKLLEAYIQEARKNREIPTDTDATLKGQFCGEYPDLCPPIN